MERNSAKATGLVTNQLLDASGQTVMRLAGADVGRNREDQRRRRLWRIAVMAGAPALLLWWRILDGSPVNLLRLPSIDPMWVFIIAMVLVLGLATVGPFLFFGRSPHVVYRPEQIDTKLDDVVGIDVVKEEVVRSLNLFLAHKTFAGTMGGTPRRGLLFEGVRQFHRRDLGLRLDDPPQTSTQRSGARCERGGCPDTGRHSRDLPATSRGRRECRRGAGWPL